MAGYAVTTARVDKKLIDAKVRAIKLISDKDFADKAMNLEAIGKETLAYLKGIFPKSPADYPRRGRQPLWMLYRLYNFPPKQAEQGRAGFTIKPIKSRTTEADTETIRALDMGSRAYQRHYAKGQIGSVFVTNPQADGRPGIEAGKFAFFTSDGMMLNFKAREGRHFIDKTVLFARELIAAARVRFKQQVKAQSKK